MAPLQRQVLLLTVLEGFTVADAAKILGIETEAAERSLDEARRELQRVAAVRVLVIEDEAVIALDVADIVRNAGHQVVGIAATEKTAVELAKQHSPHLVLADIQLRGGDSGIAGGQPDHALDERAGDLRHRLSRAAADGQAGRAGLRHLQAVRPRSSPRGDRPGARYRRDLTTGAARCWPVGRCARGWS
jgi:hypothetical protein